MNIFILTADTVSGVEKHDMVDFMADNPYAEFVQAREFREHLDDLECGSVVVAIFDSLMHADELAAIESEYGIK